MPTRRGTRTRHQTCSMRVGSRAYGPSEANSAIWNDRACCKSCCGASDHLSTARGLQSVHQAARGRTRKGVGRGLRVLRDAQPLAPGPARAYRRRHLEVHEMADGDTRDSVPPVLQDGGAWPHLSSPVSRIDRRRRPPFPDGPAVCRGQCQQSRIGALGGGLAVVERVCTSRRGSTRSCGATARAARELVQTIEPERGRACRPILTAVWHRFRHGSHFLEGCLTP